jgi:hypothetical protein
VTETPDGGEGARVFCWPGTSNITLHGHPSNAALHGSRCELQITYSAGHDFAALVQPAAAEVGPFMIASDGHVPSQMYH